MNCHKHNLVPSELDRLSAINYCSSRTKLPTLPSLKRLKRTKPKKYFKERSVLQKSFVRFRFRWGRRTMGFRRRQSSESNSGTENSGWKRSYLVQKSGKCRVESKIFRRVTESVRFRSFISRFFRSSFFFGSAEVLNVSSFLGVSLSWFDWAAAGLGSDLRRDYMCVWAAAYNAWKSEGTVTKCLKRKRLLCRALNKPNLQTNTCRFF